MAGEMSDLAQRLDIDLGRTPICRACLSFVSMTLDKDDGGKEARGWAHRLSRDLWQEGLEAPLREALERACGTGDAMPPQRSKTSRLEAGGRALSPR